MPVIPSCLLEPVWAEFFILIGGERPRSDPVTRWDVTAAGSRTGWSSSTSSSISARQRIRADRHPRLPGPDDRRRLDE